MRDDVNKDEKKSLIPNVFAVRIFVSKFKGNVRTVSRFCIREDKATTSWEFCGTTSRAIRKQPLDPALHINRDFGKYLCAKGSSKMQIILTIY